MARGRFLSRSISESRQLARLPSDFHRLLFLYMLPHADIEGRLDADPIRLRGQVLTYLERGLDEIALALLTLRDAELVDLYIVRGELYLAFPQFHEHQKGLRPEREGASKIPPPEMGDRGFAVDAYLSGFLAPDLTPEGVYERR